MPLALRQEQHRPSQVCSRIGHRKESSYNTVALKCEVANRKLQRIPCGGKARLIIGIPIYGTTRKDKIELVDVKSPTLAGKRGREG